MGLSCRLAVSPPRPLPWPRRPPPASACLGLPRRRVDMFDRSSYVLSSATRHGTRTRPVDRGPIFDIVDQVPVRRPAFMRTVRSSPCNDIAQHRRPRCLPLHPAVPDFARIRAAGLTYFAQWRRRKGRSYAKYHRVEFRVLRVDPIGESTIPVVGRNPDDGVHRRARPPEAAAVPRNDRLGRDHRFVPLSTGRRTDARGTGRTSVLRRLPRLAWAPSLELPGKG
jgi:hypothetical protein